MADSKDRRQFIEDLHGKYDGVYAISRTFYSEAVWPSPTVFLTSQMTGRIDDGLLSHFPDSLKYICHNGAGYDQIDIDACSRRGFLLFENCLMVGIKVANTPSVVTDATADVGIFLLIGALRNFSNGIFQLR